LKLALIIGASLIVAFGIFNYVLAILRSRGTSIGSNTYSIALRSFFTIVMLFEMLGSVFLTPILFNYDNVVLNVVQCGNLLLILVFTLKIIIQPYDVEDSYDVVDPLIYFVFHILIGAAAVVLSALIARSFVYVYGETGAIVNFCILVVATIGAPIYHIIYSITEEFFNWNDSDEWFGTGLGSCFYGMAVILSYTAMAMIAIFKEGF